jgi:lipopolysaccharide export system permease protein
VSGRTNRPPGGGSGASWCKDAEGAPVRFGILQRYIVAEVFRAFALALLTLTSIFVLVMVMAEAAKVGLSPRDILNLIPVTIPGTLPYSIPVSLLFAVTVVFGRVAADNEVVAVKTAGKSALTLLWPAFFLGAALSGALLYLSAGWIPRANQQVKLVIFKNMEEMFYKFLKKDREIPNPGWPFLIKVGDVEGRTLIDPTFKHRKSSEDPNSYDAVIQAKKAVIHFDSERHVARVYLDGAEVLEPGNIILINDNILDIPLPERSNYILEKKTQEYTNAELVAEQDRHRKQAARERKRLAIETALSIASGRIERVRWGDFRQSFVNIQYSVRQVNTLETEKQLRFALAFGSLFFVILGAPVGIRFARRDFLSAFITCFIPIILAYYPLMLLGVNLGKEGLYDPLLVLWVPNVILVVLFWLVMPPIMRH